MLIGNVKVFNLFLYPLAFGLVIWWIMTGDLILNNVLGIALTMVAISFIRVPSMKVVTFLLVGLFVYDIFWVFYSSNFFGKSVMVAVATKEANNPVATIAKALKLPTSSMVPKLQLPNKLIFGHLMLGLGDLVMPGVLLSFALKFDYFKAGNPFNGYFAVALVGYAIGLIISMTMAFVFRTAQPALLYLVPSTQLPVLFLSFVRKEFLDIWNGKGLNEDEEKYQL